MIESDINTPRLYVETSLAEGGAFALPEAQSHHLRHVLRREAGSSVRVFNGRDGEWVCTLEKGEKKTLRARPVRILRPQRAEPSSVHLIFAPIKKHRMDMLIEKAVELGVQDLHPVLTHRTQIRTLNDSRLLAHVRESAEQCERLCLPRVHPLIPLTAFWQRWPATTPVLACLERADSAPSLAHALCRIPHESPFGLLVGPEGGFDPAEKQTLESLPFVTPVSLGSAILRAETAAIAACAVAALRA